MAEVGSYYITIMPSMNKFTGEVKKQLGSIGADSGSSFSKSFTDVLKGSAIGTVLGNAISALGNQLVNGLDVGIRRIDTIQNFPKVMEALGYSTQDADRSVNLIMEHLDGLPTATQDMVSLTQSIADSTGDLDLATRAALGFNDMMLANGASQGEMTQAMGVFNRVLGKGNATAAQWMSLQSVMPAQLSMVARELMGEGASVDGLRDALNEGEIGWNDFLQAIVRLDEEGSGSVASFAEQARANSHGIGTAIDNVKNRVGAGWAEILAKIGREDISGAIDKASYGIRNAMYGVADGIQYLKDRIGETQIMENGAKVLESIGSAISNTFGGVPSAVKDVADSLVDLADGALKWLADHGDLVSSVVYGLAGAFATMQGIKLGTWLTTLPGLLKAVGGAITGGILGPAAPLLVVIGAITAGLVYFFTQTETGKAVLAALKAAFDSVVADLKAGFERIKQNLSDNMVQWQQFKTNVVTAVQNVVQGVQLFVNALVSDFINMVAQIKQNLAANKLVWEQFKASVVAKMTELMTNVTNAWTAIRTNVTNAVNMVMTNATNAFNALKASVTNVVGGVRATVTNAWNAVRTNTTNAFGATRTTAVSIWNGIKGGIQNAINGAKATVSSAVDAIKSKVSGTLSAARSSALSAFDGIRDGISERIASAKDAVSGAVDRIRDILSGSISFPHINLPHFSVYGGQAPYGIGGKGSLPSISVDWYAKGGVFDAPTLIGIGEGTSKEAALPLNDATYGAIAEGISSRMAAQGGVTVTVTGNSFVIREEADVDRVADRLAVQIARQMGAGAW